MTADLRDLFDQAGRSAPAPTLDPDAVLRRARRSRNRRVWVSAVAVGVAAAAVAVIVVAGGGLHRARPLPPTHPSPTPSGVLAADPFLSGADLSDPFGVGENSHTARVEGARPSRLNPCLPDPLRWGAADARAATYRDRGDPPGRINEYVLRFTDPPAAHRAVLAAWAALNGCQPPEHRAIPRPRLDPGSALDEYFNDGLAVGAVRVARAGEVVVVLEFASSSNDYPSSMLFKALLRALPQFPASHPGCAADPTSC